MIFALLMLAAAVAVAAVLGYLLGPLTAFGFVIILLALYFGANYRSGAVGPARKETLNAFQKPLSRD